MASLKDARDSKMKEPQGCDTETAEYCPSTLVDQIRVEKARISKHLNQRLRELTRVENLLLNSDAEALVKEAQETLWKES